MKDDPAEDIQVEILAERDELRSICRLIQRAASADGAFGDLPMKVRELALRLKYAEKQVEAIKLVLKTGHSSPF